MVIDRSTCASSVLVSVAESLAPVGSVTVPGWATLAVFARLPVADGWITASTVYVTLPPTGRSTVSAMSPVPLAAPQLAPRAPGLVVQGPVHAVVQEHHASVGVDE